ncbi:MAG: DMT family transporter [Clostridia bacterium]|nr:DMT family transporter [Clostridia bacterium]
MKHNFARHTAAPIIAAFIWGTAFAAQSICADHIEPMTFNALRGLIASITLFIIYLVYSKAVKRLAPPKQIPWKKLLPGSALCGLFLALASNMQQLGLGDTSAGKAGFITALYIVIVPILGLFIGKKCDFKVWISVAVAVLGLYFLCITDSFTIAPGDFYVFICAILFGVHIMVIDKYTQSVEGILLSLGQFIVVTILSGIGMIFFENPSIAEIQKCILPTLYVGIFSSGVAYTLQIIAMKGANPTKISLLLSLESVFAVVGGTFIGEKLSGREYIGCILMFGAVVLSQLPSKKENKPK